KLAAFGLKETMPKHVAVKEAVFPFARFAGVDILLGPEMKSTGEVMGIDADFGRAYAKAQLGAGTGLPLSGTVFVSVKDRDKALAADITRDLVALGFAVVATRGTGKVLEEAGLPVTIVNKVMEGRPHCVDMILSGGIQMIINTTDSAMSVADSFSIRRTALTNNIAHTTTMTGAKAVVAGIRALKIEGLDVRPLQGYF
ncbi:MAG: carbamoyl phosphate synthase large subunit, partial [Rhodospirillaceae bacterium]|nr:carbamoyl phosphate synthase large subunit [Rhodospirillaceae bacterium]